MLEILLLMAAVEFSSIETVVTSDVIIAVEIIGTIAIIHRIVSHIREVRDKLDVPAINYNVEYSARGWIL